MLLVLTAMLLYIILSNSTIWRKDVLYININMIQETLFELIDTTIYVFFTQWEVLVCIEDNNILETQLTSLMTLDKLVEDRSEGRTRANAHNIFSSFLFSLLNVCLKMVGNVDSSFFNSWEDISRNLLKTCYLRAFNSCCRTIKLLRYLIEYNL